MLKRRSGLGALIPGAEFPEGTSAELVPIVQIAVNPYQPRRNFAPEALEELVESIRQHGILQPLSVRPREGGYELIAGERRLQAARKAGLTNVPVTVRECTDEEMLALALVENLQREDLNPMEAARSYAQLMQEFALSQRDVAERVGKSRSAVANTMRLLGLPEEMQQAVAEGKMSEGHARTLLSVEDEDKRRALFRDVVERGISVRALEAMSKPSAEVSPTAKVPAKGGKSVGGDPHLQQVQSELQVALATRVRFRPGSNAENGAIEIEYYSADDLQRLYELLGQ